MVDEANADNPQGKLPLVRLRVSHQCVRCCCMHICGLDLYSSFQLTSSYYHNSLFDMPAQELVSMIHRNLPVESPSYHCLGASCSYSK